MAKDRRNQEDKKSVNLFPMSLMEIQAPNPKQRNEDYLESSKKQKNHETKH